MQSALQQLENNIVVFEALCGILALLQISFLGWVFYKLLQPLADFTCILKDTENPLYPIILVVWMLIVYLACLAYICIAWIGLLMLDVGGPLLSICGPIVRLISITTYPVAIFALLAFVETKRGIESLTGWAVTILAYIAALGLLWMTGELFALNDFSLQGPSGESRGYSRI
ncbi:hypothetical protein EJ02DRAFT_247488 [Clathrospora elynae]|uniref:Uncharacterized protein n=1 Tax=Clathrospora elynae TaxID=706981 RepID=A0A6A5T3E0_9PLEO|nr:hypothetical protein EJ02DRAFT_247488 [Clathrospora elynae]